MCEEIEITEIIGIRRFPKKAEIIEIDKLSGIELDFLVLTSEKIEARIQYEGNFRQLQSATIVCGKKYWIEHNVGWQFIGPLIDKYEIMLLPDRPIILGPKQFEALGKAIDNVNILEGKKGALRFLWSPWYTKACKDIKNEGLFKLWQDK